MARKTQLRRKQQDNVYFFNARRHISAARGEQEASHVRRVYITVWMMNSRVVCEDSDNGVLPRERKPEHWAPLAARTAHAHRGGQRSPFSPTVVRGAKRLRKSVFKFIICFFLAFLLLLHKCLLQNDVNILRENRIIDMCPYFLHMYNANTRFYS